MKHLDIEAIKKKQQLYKFLMQRYGSDQSVLGNWVVVSQLEALYDFLYSDNSQLSVDLEEMQLNKEGISATFQGSACHALANYFYDILKSYKDAVNYIELQFTAYAKEERATRITVTVAYTYGKTAHELRKKADQEADALAKILAVILIEARDRLPETLVLEADKILKDRTLRDVTEAV